jgi:uncharacterized protein YjbI with pentapeptide repeats
MMVAMPPRPKASTTAKTPTTPKKPTLSGPDLPPVEELAPFEAAPQDEGHYDCLRADDTSWGPDTLADHARFSQCAFAGVTIEGGEWTRTTFADVRFTDSRLLAPDLSASHWRDAEVRGGIASGVQWIGADIRRTRFVEVKLDSVNFRDATLTDVVFTDCLLREADFAGATLVRVQFPGCTFERAEFGRVKLNDVDFRRARLELRSGWDSLRGAVIDSAQLVELAPAFAAHLGIRVSDDPDGD